MGMHEPKEVAEADKSRSRGVVSFFVGPDRVQETKFSFRERSVALVVIVDL